MLTVSTNQVLPYAWAINLGNSLLCQPV